MAQVTSILTLRQYFGLSQEFLASYFGVSRSLLNMAERGERTLPLPATTKLAALMQFANAKSAPPPQPVKKKAAKKGDTNGNKLSDLATDCSLMVYKLRQQLDEAKLQYEQSMQAGRLANFLAAAPVDKKEKKDLTLWLTVLQNEAGRKEERYSLQAQAVLQ
jgi:transcriptional regulator with XRE-family HTH domain